MSSNNIHSPINVPLEIRGSPVTLEHNSLVNSSIGVDVIECNDFLNDTFREDLEILPPEHLRYINNLRKRVLSLEHNYHEAKQSRIFWLNEYHELGHRADDMAQLINQMGTQISSLKSDFYHVNASASRKETEIRAIRSQYGKDVESLKIEVQKWFGFYLDTKHPMLFQQYDSAPSTTIAPLTSMLSVPRIPNAVDPSM